MAGRSGREVTLPKSSKNLKDIPTTAGIKTKLYVGNKKFDVTYELAEARP